MCLSTTDIFEIFRNIKSTTFSTENVAACNYNIFESYYLLALYNDVYCLLISCADIVRQIYEKYAIKDKIIAAIYDSFKCILNDTRQLE